MSNIVFSHEEIVQQARFSPEDMAEIQKRSQDHTRLGFSYQLAFVRLSHRFPAQQPMEIIDDLLVYVSVQLDIPTDKIELYQRRQPTVAEHRIALLEYLNLRRFGEAETELLEKFLFEEACRLEQTGPLLVQAKQFLKENGILFPADDTLRRLIVTQKQAAREFIYVRVANSLSSVFKERLDEMLIAGDKRLTPFQSLKESPGKASPNSILRLATKLELIQTTGILDIDLSWLNNNYQRSLTRYARRCSADRMRNLKEDHRYTVLVCFLWQVFRDTIDQMVETHHKLMTRIYNHAQGDVDEQTRKQQRMIRGSLATLYTMGQVILDQAIADEALRQTLFDKVDREKLTVQMADVETWLTGKYSHVFNLVVERFSYIRQFAPTLIEQLDFRLEEGVQSTLVDAVKLLRQLNEDNKRKLPDDVPLGFIPKKLRPLVEKNGEVSKRAWECALLTVIRDEIKAGNIYVQRSQRFGRFDDFFMADDKWEKQRENFFNRAGLPVKAEDVPDYLTVRLNQAYDDFLELLPKNSYATVSENGWQLSVDSSDKLDEVGKQKLEKLNAWLAENMRTIRLPALLIEVDNELHVTHHFMNPQQQQQRTAEDVCTVLATVMAHGCNVGPYTMSRLTEGITYRQIKWVTDWQLLEEAQRQALAQVVNAISKLDVTQAWGEGKTSSSDGQRFRMKRKLLQQTYSPRFNDYAIEFYSFVADNYAPFYSTVIECTDRDAAFVLDGLLYNESDLLLEEHYTDTHGYTEINFAAFAILGRRFAPRIRGLKKQRIYRIDKEKEYDSLTPLVDRWDSTIHLDWICEQWDRMGQFYASLEYGHVTASTALKRLASYSGKNHFYRANRELGRVFKTEFILQFMSDPLVRKQIRRGLLKGEEVNALARQVAYGKQGTITARDLQAQKNTASCLTLIMACIIYWQAKEINRVILESDPDAAGVDLALLEHISPIGWENVILYGEYVLNRGLIK
jgi:TnpA family transposase